MFNGRRFAGWLLVATLFAYLPVYSAGWIWDDDYYVTENEALRSVEGLGRIWTDTSTTPQYYPLTHTSFWLQYQLFGLNPFVFHLVNVLLHALAALFLWRTLVVLSIPGARLAAMLFALHPVHVESVAWVTERKNVLCGLFFFAAAWLYLRSPKPTMKRSVGVFLLFLAALFAKTVAAALPIALLMVLIWKRRFRRQDLFTLLPMLTVGMLLGRITARLEREQVLAVGPEWDFSFAERWLIAGRAVWFYLSKLLVPIDLAFLYPRWSLDSGSLGQWAFLIAAFGVLLVTLLLAVKKSASPLVAALYFGLCLGPALGFFNVYPMRYSFVADHFQYLASVGPLAFIAAFAVYLADRGALSTAARQVGALLLALVLIALTMTQARNYHDAETLWRATTETTPSAWMAHHNLGYLLEGRGDLEEAIERYQAAVEYNPALTEAWVGIGTAQIALGMPQLALDPLQRARSLDPKNSAAEYNQALALQRLQRFSEAASGYAALLRREPELGKAHHNFAVCLYYLGQYPLAARALSDAQRLGEAVDPAFVAALRAELSPPGN